MKYLIYLFLLISIPANSALIQWKGSKDNLYYSDSGVCITEQKRIWDTQWASYVRCRTWTHTLGTNTIGAGLGGCAGGGVWCTVQGGCVKPAGFVCAYPGYPVVNDGCIWTCSTDPPPCSAPEVHPCDVYDPNGPPVTVSKNLSCRFGMIWDSAICDYKHKYGCTTADGYSGPFGGYFSGGQGYVLGQKSCIFGCEYYLDEVNSDGTGHSSITMTSCSGVTPPITGDYDNEIIEEDDVVWEPDNDLDTGTNCGEFNGEYLCVESIPDGSCVQTPSGGVVCVSPPPAIPDTPIPVTPDLSITNPGENPSDPADDDRVDYYGPNTINPVVPQCPNGSTYVAGKCVAAPNPDGSCPPGYIKYGDQCILDKDIGGPFGGSSGGLGPGLGGPPAFSYLDTLMVFYDQVESSPILDFAPSCGTGSASCPSLSVMGFTTRIHCDLSDEAIPMISAFFWLVAGLVAIRAVFSA